MNKVTMTNFEARIFSDAGTDIPLRNKILNHLQELKEKGFTTSQLLQVEGVSITIRFKPQKESHPLTPYVEVSIREESR